MPAVNAPCAVTLNIDISSVPLAVARYEPLGEYAAALGHLETPGKG